MKKIKHFIYLLNQVRHNLLTRSWEFIKRGYEVGQLKRYMFFYCRHVFNFIRHFGGHLAAELGQGDLNSVQIKRLNQLTKGIHQLISKDGSFSYSILIALTSTTLVQFKNTLKSALQQTAPNLEILVGYHSLISADIQKFLQDQVNEHPHVKMVLLASIQEQTMLNELAEKATKDWLVCLGAKDWLRPDYLFRCEQLLRLLPADSYCLYTQTQPINDVGIELITRPASIDPRLPFPYSFQNLIGRSTMIRKQAWRQAGGLQFHPEQEGFWDLAWRLFLNGVKFEYLPFSLYLKCQTAQTSAEETALIPHLESYSKRLHLNWKWEKGLIPHSYRAIPALDALPTIQVIIPYKNQKDLTLKTVKTALQQQNVKVYITAVDNHSTDETIGQAIEQMGGEVLRIKEPFNYSRLNNLAVQQTKTAQHCDLIVFLNNDVELEPQALEEMARWITQPSIGIVGCQLYYPNGLLQHGGVDLLKTRPAYQMVWSHAEKMCSKEKQTSTKTLRVTDAVTAACALMRRQVFIEVGGFDETWYPIAYSDTNLAIKLQAKGLLSFYTPYASGIHHESVSRHCENIEDVEHSAWLHDHYIRHHQLKFSPKQANHVA